MIPPAVEFPASALDGHLPRHLSNDFRIAITPAATFPLLIAERRHGSWLAAFSRPLFLSVVLGCVTSISTTGVVSAISILSGTVCWSFVPAVQMASGLWLCRRAPAPTTDPARALELLFLTHAPWTLWAVLAGLQLLLLPLSQIGLPILVATACIPAIWTRRLVRAFCIYVLGCGPAEARRRTRVHQITAWALVVAYVGWAIGVVPRIVGALS